MSAKTKDGDRRAARASSSTCCPRGPRYFPREQRPTSRSRSAIAELIREKALHLTREEVPHAITVEVEEIEEKVVRAIVYVETESQKRILVGKRGAMVREIGTRARPEIEALSATRSSSSSREGAAEVAPRSEDARAPGTLSGTRSSSRSRTRRDYTRSMARRPHSPAASSSRPARGCRASARSTRSRSRSARRRSRSARSSASRSC